MSDPAGEPQAVGGPDGPAEVARVRRLLEVGRSLTKELDRGTVFDRILAAAREITGARYAAIGILDDDRSELCEFITSGIDPETHRTIGDLPRGRGVLGELIRDPRPLRLADVDQHPSSYGFPIGHPLMRTFLGVPVLIDGSAWGNLYLTDKDGGEFTVADEESAVVLADWAAIAIENSRLYETSESRRQELERAVARIEATHEVSAAINAELELEKVLELIVKRGRALVDARSLVIMLREAEELVVHAGAGHADDVRGMRLPIADSTSGQVLEQRRAQRIADVASRLRIAPADFGVQDARTALLVPMVHRGRSIGVLVAFDQGEESAEFGEDDEEMLHSFAASAAAAVALARSVQADRLHSSVAAADAERRRWARQLHDETMQGLGAVKLLLSAASGRDDLDLARQTIQEAVGHLDREIESLGAIISELRPALLEELGLQAAIEALLDHHKDRSGIETDARFELPAAGDGGIPLGPDVESTAYRLVQEALANVVKHAEADRVAVRVDGSQGELLIRVEDDGTGFDADGDGDGDGQGFGLAGMRERVDLVAGDLSIDSSARGTVIEIRLPIAGPAAGTSGSWQAAS